MFSKQPIIVEVVRGQAVESVHQVMVAVVNEGGSLLHSWGNALYLTFPRSAIKMLQAIPLIESGAADKFQLEEKHIALACASHRGEKAHLEALSQWMEKAKIPESCYVCGPHLPYNEASAHDFIRRGQKPTVLCNNCAGKHSAIISTCLHLGENPEGYEKLDHNAQKRLRKVLTETMKYDHAKAASGIDGCGIPSYAVPLQHIATGMSVFVNSKEAPARKAACERILKAVTNNPFFISGSDEFATAVIEKTQGRAIVKGGAEGVMAGFLPEKKMAFALKCADGAGRATQLATVQLLLQLGGLTLEEAKSLSKYSQPSVTNWKGDVVGQLRIAKPT
ncbi:asparaginase [Bdellovibrio svalbardensis]|uniref:Asparaginase n=1 Tax=Bdellovibrio svalbardensis TaxID=2972972 RepID=A0ABT6DGZ8_9BACT|nr:asparaginase [Bdellovibrio svalbardensis]MDG0816096.1 asparaginase [Bdellovibrio svalbardensis]